MRVVWPVDEVLYVLAYEFVKLLEHSFRLLHDRERKRVDNRLAAEASRRQPARLSTAAVQQLIDFRT